MPTRVALVTNSPPAGTAFPAASLESTYVAAGSTRALTDAESRSTVLLDTATGSVVTLPAATGSGRTYRFIVSVLATTNSHIVKVGVASDIIIGVLGIVGSSSTAFAANGTTHDGITLNRTTTGSVSKGEWFFLEDIASGVWHVRGYLTASGAPATPFGALV